MTNLTQIIEQLSAGTYVRSFDFPSRDDQTVEACFAEGFIRRIIPAGSVAMDFDCDRYEIVVTRRVIGGEEAEIRVTEQRVYPPVNGIPIWGSERLTNGVVECCNPKYANADDFDSETDPVFNG